MAVTSTRCFCLGFDTQDGAYPSSSIIYQGVGVGQTEKRLEILNALWGARDVTGSRSSR